MAMDGIMATGLIPMIPIIFHRKINISNRNKGGIPTAIRTAAANEQDLRKFYGSWLIPHGFSEEYIMTIPLDKLENLFNDMMGT